MPTVLAPITITVDDQPVASETTLRRAGAYVLVITTALPEIPLTVFSTFVGARDTDTTIVDVTLGLRPRANTETRRLPRDELPVTHAHDRCLLEHAAAVRAAIADTTTMHVSVEVSDAALAVASGV